MDSWQLRATTKKRALRWSLISAGAIALFWLVFYIKNGYVPVVGDAPGSYWPVACLSGMSRWWDVLIGPLWAFPLAFAATFLTKEGLDDDDVNIAHGAVVGFVVGAVVGFVYGPTIGFNLSFIAGLIVGIATSLVYDAGIAIVATFVYVLMVTFAYSLLAGLMVGIVVWPAYFGYYSALFIFVFGFLFNIKQISKKIAHWLLAKEES